MTQQYIDPRRQVARDSFTGSRMTDSQFDEAWHIAGIINREIHRSGSFITTLGKYATAFETDRKFNKDRAEVILRDIYSARYGESMNKTREGLLNKEAAIRDTIQPQALHHARSIGDMIASGPTMPFYQTADIAGTTMARAHSITESGAKKMMAEAFERADGPSLREYGKELEEKHHTPVREAARAARKREQAQMQRSVPQR